MITTFVAILSMPILAASWTGAAGNKLWSDSGNWNNGEKPTAESQIDICSSVKGEIIVDEDCTFGGQLLIHSGADVTFTGTGHLKCSYGGLCCYFYSNSKVVFDGPSFTATNSGGWNMYEGALLELRAGSFVFGTGHTSGALRILGGNLTIDRLARSATSQLVLDGGSLLCDTDNGTASGLTNFEYIRGKLALGYGDISNPGYLPKTSDSVLFARSTSAAAFDPFGTTAGASFDMPGTVYVTNSLTASTTTGNTSDFREVDVGGRGTLYTGRLWFKNDAGQESAHAAHLDLDAVYAKQLDRNTWHSTGEFFNGVTFGIIGSDEKSNSGLALRFNGLLDVDTADPFTGAKLTRTFDGPTIFSTSPSLRVRGGGTFVFGATTVPMLGSIEVCEGTTLKVANGTGALYYRAGALKLGKNSVLRLEGSIPRIQSVFGPAEIDSTATIQIVLNGTPAANHRYGILDCGPGGDVSKVNLVVENLPDGWEVRKFAQFAYLADANVTPTSKYRWLGAGETGNWSEAANWATAEVPGKNSSPHFTVSTNNIVVNDTGAELKLAAMEFLDGSGPYILRGSTYRVSQPYINSSSSALKHTSYNMCGVVYETPIHFDNTTMVYSGSTRGYWGFYGGVDSKTSRYVFGGDARLGGTCTFKGITPYAVYNSNEVVGYTSELTLVNGADVEVTAQDEMFTYNAKINIAPTAKLRFTGGEYNAATNAAMTTTVYGEMDIDVPFLTSKTQGFYGTGTVHIASTKSHPDGSGVVSLGGGITFYSDGFSTVTDDASANRLKIKLASDVTLGAKTDWAYGPQAGVVTTTTPGDRALVAAGVYAKLTVDTEDPSTKDGHTITLADPLVSPNGYVTKKGAGTLVLATTNDLTAAKVAVTGGTLAYEADQAFGKLTLTSGTALQSGYDGQDVAKLTVDGDVSVEGAVIGLSKDAVAFGGRNWTTVMTVSNGKSITGTPKAAARQKVRIVGNAVQCRAMCGMIVIAR